MLNEILFHSNSVSLITHITVADHKSVDKNILFRISQIEKYIHLLSPASIIFVHLLQM